MMVFRCMLALSALVLLLSSPIQRGVEQGGKVRIGDQQSPIDIQTSDVQINQTLGELKQQYKSANATMFHKEHAIQVTWTEDAGSLEIGDVEYRLNQSHWHHPSEHTINGIQYPLELHMVHLSDNGSIAVVGILYQIGASDEFLLTLENAIDKIADIPEMDLDDVNLKIIGIAENAAYYRYNGSLTTEPYTEGVSWTVIKEVKNVTQEQVDGLRNTLHGMNNSREVQPLNGRIVQLYEDDPHVVISEIHKAEETVLSLSS